MTSPPPSTSPGPKSPGWFGRLPIGGGKKTTFIIGAIVAAVVIGVIVAIIVSQQNPGNTTISSSAPNVKFIKFGLQNQEIKVGASTNLVFNVENSEDRVIDSARVVITVQPQVGSNYLAISNQTIDLSVLPPNARTGERVVSITVTGTPALEAVYTMRGILTVDGTPTDIQDLSLTIKQ
jgi:hypothetical protein